MKDLMSSLLDTTKTLKFDWDSTFPSWWLLKNIFNCSYFYGANNVKIERSIRSDGLHIFVEGVKSNLDLRRAGADDRGRIFCTEYRQQQFYVPSDIIYAKGKAIFQVRQNNSKLIFKWKRKPKGYEQVDLKDLTRLPFKLSELDFHRLHRRRFFRRKAWKLRQYKGTEMFKLHIFKNNLWKNEKNNNY